MDPMTVAYIASLIANVGGSIVKPIADKLKRKHEATVNEVVLAIQSAVARLTNRNEQRAEELTNKLANLAIVRKTPALEKVIAKEKEKLTKEIKDLRDEVAETNITAAGLENKLQEASDEYTSRKFPNAVAKLKFKNQKENILNGLQDIEKKIQ